MKRKIKLAFCFLAVAFAAYAQQELLPVKQDKNSIRNAVSLDKIFRLLNKNNQSVITFFHFGDSHIQADYFTGEIRRSLQKTFGNAGRGLVFPYHQMRTNGPGDYTFRSNETWEGRKLIKSLGNADCGLSGYAILPVGNHASHELDFLFKQDSCQSNFVKTVQILYNEGEVNPAFNFYVNSSTGMAKFAGRKYKLNTVLDSFTFDTPVTDFNTTIHLAGNTRLLIDGLLLLNGQNGIVYHSAGVNGAKFSQFNHSPKFMDELMMIKPSLVIMSLGTNESADKYDSLSFILTVDSLVKKIEALGSTVLLTTPANNYLPYKGHKNIVKNGRKRRVKIKGYANNITVGLIRDNLVAYCDARHLPYWDLYEIMGGDHSMKLWVEQGKAARDYLHFSKGGYTIQGQLFYKAFYDAYLQFLSK